jgi:hypothetical protein
MNIGSYISLILFIGSLIINFATVYFANKRQLEINQTLEKYVTKDQLEEIQEKMNKLDDIKLNKESHEIYMDGLNIRLDTIETLLRDLINRVN